jgi:hypothetical protein
MISNILTLYFLGFLLLVFFDFLGLCFFRFKNINNFLGLFIGYLTFMSVYAITKSGGNSIGVLVVVWIIGYFFAIKKEEALVTIKKQSYLQRVMIIGVLWSFIFLLKVSCFWNIEYNCPNLLFVDYEFYMKVAEGYSLSGYENVFGLKNVLLPFLNFAQPYRSNDLWLTSLGLDITNIDTIYIWELFYSTVVLFMCSLSLFVILKKRINLFYSLLLSVIILFAFAGYWYRDIINLFYAPNPGAYDPIGIVAYTKLAITFSIIFYFFYKYESNQKIEGLYFLILIPLLQQPSIALFLLIFLLVVYFSFSNKRLIKKQFKFFLPIIGVFGFLTFGFLIFYLLNQQIEEFHVGYSNLSIDNNFSTIKFITEFLKKAVLMFLSYYWLSFLIAIFLLFFSKYLGKSIRIELLIILFLCYISCISVYAKFVEIGDSYQFLTNTFGPFVIALIIYLLVQAPINLKSSRVKLALLILISLIGMKQTIGGNNVFHSTSRIHYYDKEFISEVKTVLPQLDYPLGIIYYGDDLQNHPKESFPLYDATFLKLFGRYYDVFNIEADKLKLDSLNQAKQKINYSIKKNALNLWLYKSNYLLSGEEEVSNTDFYDSFPFSFCISRISKDNLPEYIKKDVISVIRDEKSKIYFYRLRREMTNFTNLKLYKKR